MSLHFDRYFGLLLDLHFHFHPFFFHPVRGITGLHEFKHLQIHTGSILSTVMRSIGHRHCDSNSLHFRAALAHGETSRNGRGVRRHISRLNRLHDLSNLLYLIRAVFASVLFCASTTFCASAVFCSFEASWSFCAAALCACHLCFPQSVTLGARLEAVTIVDVTACLCAHNGRGEFQTLQVTSCCDRSSIFGFRHARLQ